MEVKCGVEEINENGDVISGLVFSTQNNNMDYGCAFCKWGSYHSTKHHIPLNFGLIHLISLREYLKWRSLLT